MLLVWFDDFRRDLDSKMWLLAGQAGSGKIRLVLEGQSILV